MLLQYDVQSPMSRPTGGTGLAVAGMSVELAHRGHEVFVSTQIAQDDWYECAGVTMAPIGWRDGDEVVAKLQSLCTEVNADVAIVLNHVWIASVLRPVAKTSSRWLLWTHNFDEPWVHRLQQPEVQASWDQIIFVSRTQHDFYKSKYDNLRFVRSGCFVMHNSLSSIMVSDDWNATKERGPVVAYTSMADRGLPFLLQVWPQIRAAIPDAELWVFSPMINYSQELIVDPVQYPEWYRQMLALEGVVYDGWQSHAELARKLTQVRVLANCNYEVPETFCLINVEAMARGCSVVTSNIGAIPEVVMGNARVLSEADPVTWGKVIVESLLSWDAISASQRRDWVNETYDIRNSVDGLLSRLV